MTKFSVVIPVFNRPDEVRELLESLQNQTCTDFEVLIVEDGSSVSCKAIVDLFTNQLAIRYFAKHNTGPGLTRNYGADRAQGDYIIFFDSDCIIPSHFFDELNSELTNRPVDAFGGPDRALPTFSPVQKAINYSMTSFLTTGGIRGGKKKLDVFHPRSFNMGYSKEVYQATGGFSAMRFGEDIDMSLRIIQAGFSTRLFPNAYVYHKRRTDFQKFFKQVHNSGIARINLYKKYPQSLKLVHMLPAIFTVGLAGVLLLAVFLPALLLLPLFFALLIMADSSMQNKNGYIGLLSIPASFIQLTGYGTGFLRGVWNRLILRKPEFSAFTKNFYK